MKVCINRTIRIVNLQYGINSFSQHFSESFHFFIIDCPAQMSIAGDLYVIQIKGIHKFIFRNYNGGPAAKCMSDSELIKSIYVGSRNIGYYYISIQQLLVHVKI